MLRLAQYGWGIVMLGTVVLCAGFAVGASTDRSVRRHGVPPDGGSLIADKPQVPTGIPYSSQNTNFNPDVKKRCDLSSLKIFKVQPVDTLRVSGWNISGTLTSRLAKSVRSDA